MSVTTMIGLRYYRARSTNGFISLVTMVSFIGLVLGVIALVVVVSVMNGFDRELKQRILGAVPHVTVSDVSIDDLATELAGFSVKAITPFQESQLLILTECRKPPGHRLRYQPGDRRRSVDSRSVDG